MHGWPTQMTVVAEHQQQQQVRLPALDLATRWTQTSGPRSLPIIRSCGVCFEEVVATAKLFFANVHTIQAPFISHHPTICASTSRHVDSSIRILNSAQSTVTPHLLTQTCPTRSST